MRRFLFSMLSLVGLVACVIPCFGAGQRYALVIGITGYPHFPECGKLRFADDDARLFSTFIMTEEGGRFPADNVHLIENNGATREAIKDGVMWLSRRVEHDDIVYIFFSGHGVLDDLGLAYFMPYDADPQKPDYRGFRADHFVEELRLKISSRYLVLFVDACHSGSLLSGGLAKAGVANITRSLNQAWEDSYKGQDAISMAFLSAGSNQSSYEDSTLGHGLFTYYLVQGLEGRADETGIGDGDGLVTAGELYRYILDRVEHHARYELNGKEQSPTKSPEFTPSFPFAVSGEACMSMISSAEEAREYYNEAQKLVESRGDVDGAIRQYRKAIGVDPVYADAHAHLGFLLHVKGDLDGAMEEYMTAIDIDPNHTTSRYNLAIVLESQGDLQAAIAEYRKVIHIDPDNADAHFNLGNAYYDTKNFVGAIEAYRDALRIEPANCMIHNNLGLALKSRGEMNSAAAEYREALTLNPDYAPAHCNLGVIYLDRGQLDAAVSELRTAIGIDPDLAKAHWHLGRVLRRMGALLEAAAEFDRFAESTPNRARAESARREAERLRKLAKKLGQTQQ